MNNVCYTRNCASKLLFMKTNAITNHHHHDCIALSYRLEKKIWKRCTYFQ